MNGSSTDKLYSAESIELQPTGFFYACREETSRTIVKKGSRFEIGSRYRNLASCRLRLTTDDSDETGKPLSNESGSLRSYVCCVGLETSCPSWRGLPRSFPRPLPVRQGPQIQNTADLNGLLHLQAVNVKLRRRACSRNSCRKGLVSDGCGFGLTRSRNPRKKKEIPRVHLVDVDLVLEVVSCRTSMKCFEDR